MALSRLPEGERKSREILKNSFAHLAAFIPHDEVQIEVRGQDALRSGHARFEDLQYIEKAIEISVSILEAQQTLKEEIERVFP